MIKLFKKTSVLMLALISLSACATKKELTRNLDEYYVSSGVEQYFLSEVPSWINFSFESGCKREKTLRYFNIEALMKSFSLSYVDAIQVQATFNQDYLVLKETIDGIFPVKEEEVLFYKSTEKVSNKIFFFDAPKFKRIHLIWLDEALLSDAGMKKFNSFVNSSTNDEGFPVYVTNCMTRPEVEKHFPKIGNKVITSEMFSVYNKLGQREARAMLDISGFFSPSQELILYMQDKTKRMKQLEGNFKVLNY